MTYTIGVLESTNSKNSEAFVIKTDRLNYMIDTGYKAAAISLSILYNNVSDHKGDNNLDILVISHGDADHSRGFTKVVTEFKPKIVLFSPLHLAEYCIIESLSNTSVSLEVIDALRKRNSEVIKYYLTNRDYKLYYTEHQNEQRDEGNVYIALAQMLDLPIGLIKVEDASLANKMILVPCEVAHSGNINEYISTLAVNELELFDTGQILDITLNIQKFIQSLSHSDQINKIVQNLKTYNLLYLTDNRNTFNEEQFIKLFKSKVLKHINNGMSLVVRIQTALFTGDAELPQIEKVKNEIVKRKLSLNVIKVPHHGSQYNHDSSFYTLTQPEIAFIKTSTLVDRPNNCQSLQTSRDLRSKGIQTYSIHSSQISNKQPRVGYIILPGSQKPLVI